MKFRFENPKFIKTATNEEHYPVLRDQSGNVLPEIAVAGRSNVGKSSLLNHLFQRRGLVKTSSTPGKTQAINFFTVNDSLCFVDLPGYGYATVPLHIRKKWGPMVHGYLESREQLKLILFLFDIRRMPNEDDHRMMEWIQHRQLPVILVFTKVDKVKTRERKENQEKILEAFGIDMDEENGIKTVKYSVTKNVGRIELLSLINKEII